MAAGGRIAPGVSRRSQRNGIATRLLYVVALAVAASWSAMLLLLVLPLRLLGGLRRR
jgi:hypothetical protein